jgi:DNA repair exonuclease SbcCD ATPase subunit
MIEQVEVVNWKAFERKKIGLSPGLNLLIGRNASGKTTVLDAISVALVGETDETPIFKYLVRDKAKTSSIALRLALNGRHFSVKRSFTSERTRGAWVSENGEEEAVTWDEATRRVEKFLGASREFLRRIAYVSEGAVFRYLQEPPSSALTGQIERLFGIDILQEYLRDLQSMQPEIRSEISDTEEAWSAIEIPNNLPKLLKDVVEKLDALDETTRAKKREAQATIRKITDLERAKEMQERVTALLDTLVSAARTEGLTVDDSAPIESLGKSIVNASLNMVKVATQKLEEAKGQSNSIATRLKYLTDLENVARESEKALRTRLTGQKCPVCKRPLEESHVKTILSEVREERSRLVDEAAQIAKTISGLEAEVRDLEKRRRDAEKALTELLTYTRLLKVDTVASTREVFRGIDKRLSEARTKLGQLEREVEARNKQSRTLAEEKAKLEETRKQAEQLPTVRARQVRLRASEFLAEIVARAISEALEEERRTNISAIQNNLSRLWSRFRGGQESIEFRPDGEIFLVRQGDRLAFHQLSGGEKTVLLVLAQTVAARALSNLDFLLIDEPLEHLDLENRRSLLNFLVQSSKHQFLSQMIVSTFEESLTRKYLEEQAVRPTYL